MMRFLCVLFSRSRRGPVDTHPRSVHHHRMLCTLRADPAPRRSARDSRSCARCAGAHTPTRPRHLADRLLGRCCTCSSRHSTNPTDQACVLHSRNLLCVPRSIAADSNACANHAAKSACASNVSLICRLRSGRAGPRPNTSHGLRFCEVD